MTEQACHALWLLSMISTGLALSGAIICLISFIYADTWTARWGFGFGTVGCGLLVWFGIWAGSTIGFSC